MRPSNSTIAPIPPLDVIGDVHGHYDALMRLGARLGYRQDWTHPDGRFPVFLGDLIDRGPRSFDVARLVCDLASQKKALSLMGNHEYNLVNHVFCGAEKKKHTIANVVLRDREAWNPILEFFLGLPLAIELPELRLIHAVWHLDYYRRVHEVLGQAPASNAATAFDVVAGHVTLSSPFVDRRIPSRLEGSGERSDDAHELLIKGYEEPADMPFKDVDGKTRTRTRVTWWRGDRPEIPRDRRTVFGHYWNVPPHAAPPAPSGHPDLRRWQAEQARELQRDGSSNLDPSALFICVDYNGVGMGLKATADGETRPCVGAYRWPEHEIAWAGA